MSDLLVLRLESLEHGSIQQVCSLSAGCHPVTLNLSPPKKFALRYPPKYSTQEKWLFSRDTTHSASKNNRIISTTYVKVMLGSFGVTSGSILVQKQFFEELEFP